MHVRKCFLIAATITAALLLNLKPAQALNVPTNGTVQWTDNFSGDTVGNFPSPPWTNSGNTQANVTNTTAAPGDTNSLFLFGLIGQDWAAVANRQFTIAPGGYLISFNVDNGSESLSGIHATYGGAGIASGPVWTDPGIDMINFGDDGIIHGQSLNEADSVSQELSGPNLGTFVANKWYNVQIVYLPVDSSSYSLSYWINGSYKGTFNEANIAQQSGLDYLSLNGAAGSAWFDDVSVASLPGSTPTPPTPPSAVPLPSSASMTALTLAGLAVLKLIMMRRSKMA